MDTQLLLNLVGYYGIVGEEPGLVSIEKSSLIVVSSFFRGKCGCGRSIMFYVARQMVCSSEFRTLICCALMK